MVDPKGVNLLVMAKADEESGIDSCFTGGGGRVAGSRLLIGAYLCDLVRLFSCTYLA